MKDNSLEWRNIDRGCEAGLGLQTEGLLKAVCARDEGIPSENHLKALEQTHCGPSRPWHRVLITVAQRDIYFPSISTSEILGHAERQASGAKNACCEGLLDCRFASWDVRKQARQIPSQVVKISSCDTLDAWKKAVLQSSD